MEGRARVSRWWNTCLLKQWNHSLCFWRMLLALISPD